jgi:glycosyltransferase involved in cell wall biosynthesis
MHIAIDLRPLISPFKTGIGEYGSELLKAILTLDQKNNYYLFSNSFKGIKLDLPGIASQNVKIVSTHWPNKLFNSLAAMIHRPQIDKIINKKFNITLDHFFSPNLNFTTISKNTKFALTVHDLSFEIYPHFFSAKQRLWHQLIKPKTQCMRADVIYTPSENTKRDLINVYTIESQKIKVIYPGLAKIFTDGELATSTDEIKKKYQLPDNFILFLGTSEPRKNLLGILKEFELLPQNLNTHLVIAGSPGWKQHNIQHQLASSKLKNRIKILDYIPNEDKPALYSLAKLFVYPSFYEGFGFPVLEAMASGTPVVTSNRSSLPEITGLNAYLVNPHKINELALGMQTLLTDEDTRNNLIKNSLGIAQKFSWEKAAQEWFETLQIEYK